MTALLPVDAHTQFTHAPDGSILRPRTLSYDATFSTTPSSKQTIHYLSKKVELKSRAAVRTFDDRRQWWYNRDEHTVTTHPGRYQPGWYSVNVPNTGTSIQVVKLDKKSKVMTVRVSRAR